jgi:ABC-type lipoprotein export system ATPase subunit
VANLLVDLHARERFILIVVTHSPALAERFTARYLLDQGRLVPPDSTEHVLPGRR